MAHGNQDVPSLDYGHVRPADSTHGHDDHEHSVRPYLIVFAALGVLMAATVGAAYVNLGYFNVPVAYAIASLKASLILWFFMHLNRSTRLVQVFAFASFAWLLIFLIMTLGDYVSRNIMARADPMTGIRKVDSYEAASGMRAAQNVRPEDDTGVQRRGSSPKSTDHKSE
jgi:cytochrome c oxidase subunit 4